jgi:hypothetical protein
MAPPCGAVQDVHFDWIEAVLVADGRSGAEKASPLLSYSKAEAMLTQAEESEDATCLEIEVDGVRANVPVSKSWKKAAKAQEISAACSVTNVNVAAVIVQHLCD